MPNVAVPFGGAFSASRPGAIVYQQLQAGDAALGNTIVWRSRTGEAEPLRLETGSYRSLSLSRTRAQAIVGKLDESGGGSTLWLVDLSRGVPTRFTFGRENVGVFTPEGTDVIYNAGRDGRLDLFRKRLEVGAVEERVRAGDEDWPRTPLSVAPDGKVLLFAASHPATGNDLWQVTLDGSAPPAPFLAGEFEERWGEFSPDGTRVVYESDESGRREIYVRAFRGGGALIQVSPNGGAYPRWSRDGREIYFYSAGKLFAATVRPTANGLDVTAVAPLFDATPPSGFRRLFYDVAADGRFLMITDTVSPGPTQLTLLLNWTELLRGAR
jgi:Tol biopolymer transport system component